MALVVVPALTPDLFGRSCPHHAGGHADAPPAHPAATHARNAQAPGTGAPMDAPASGHGAPCTCAGSCPVSAGPSVPSAFQDVVPETTRLDARRRSPAVAAVLPAEPAHLLPFANGPPAA